MSVDSLRAQYLVNLKQQAVFEADVPYRELDEDTLVSYLQNNLALSTQKHVSRILFKGDDTLARAEACHKLLEELEATGNLNAESFAALAREYSDEEDVEDTGGDYTWSSSDTMDGEIMTLLEYLDAGEFSGPEGIQADDALELIYCDAEYTFPGKEDISSTTLLDIPLTLLELIEDAAIEALWTSDCNAYLTWLLASAQITYYPIPEGAAYAVDMTLATS
jgi:parvulin-like peptidyl-prolyl isomerase